MSLLSLILPVAGQPDATEDVKVTNALTAIQTWANGNVDATNMTNATMTAYTPTWTGSSVNPTLGNGTLFGHYFKIGKLVLVRVYLAFGSTTLGGTGTWAFTLPVGTKVDGSTQCLTGLMNPGGTIVPCLGQLFQGSLAIAPYFAAGTQAGSTSGFVNGNVLTLHGIYESS